MLAGLVGCQTPDDQVVDDLGDEDTSTFRSGISMLGSPGAGYICFELTYQCDAPESAGIEVDGSSVWGWTAQTQYPDAPIGEAPENLCLYTDDISAGVHLYKFRATCGGVTSSTASTQYTTSHSPVSVDSIVADKAYYELGDTITLVVTGDAGMAVKADFEAIDTGYVAGSETVTVVPGGYEISYTLSTANAVGSGDFKIPVKVYDPTDPSKSRTNEVTLRYLPNGRMRAHVAHGHYRPEARPTPTIDGSITLVSVTDTSMDVSSSLADEAPNFGGATPPTGLSTGRIYDIEFRTKGSEPVASMAIDVWESSRDGYVRVPLDVSSATCNLKQCSYSGSIVLASKTPGTASASLPLTMALVSGIYGSTSTNDYLPSVPPPPPGSYLVRGTISHDVLAPTVNCASSPNTDMTCPISWAKQERPSSRMSVRFVDSCGSGKQIWTDDEGKFETLFSTYCPNDPVQVRISSYHQPSPLTISVFDRANVPSTYSSLGELHDDLTDDPNDYRVYKEEVATFVPSVDAALPNGHTFTAKVSDGNLAAGILIAHTVRQSLDYYDAWTDLSSKVHMNILFDDDEAVVDANGDNGNRNTYVATVHPGMIHIIPNSEWSQFAIAHETGHMFHYFFLRNHGSGVSNPPYGRFGESMCHIHAAAITGSPFMSVYTTHATAESMDYNGKYDESLQVAEQATMNFYPDPTEAAASLNCNPPTPDPCCSFGTVAERGNCVLAHSTGWDWRIFYDLFDNNSFFEPEPVQSFVPAGGGMPVSAPNFDGFDGKGDWPANMHKIMDVVVNYLGRGPLSNPGYVDRGQVMLDVVDVLDGMSCRGHMGTASTEDLLHLAMGYDYDFFYEDTSCP